MINANNDLMKDSLKAHTREIHAILKLYLYGDNEDPLTISEDNYLINFTTLDEISSDNGELFGSVSMNELAVSLDNTTRYFSIDNTSGPYYGLITQRTKIEVEYQVVINNKLESIIGGTYYTSKWSSSSNSNEATLVAYDRLMLLEDKSTKEIAVQANISLADFYTYVFKYFGLQYGVDFRYVGTSNDRIDFLWLENAPLLEALRMAAASHGVRISVDTYNVIVISEVTFSAEPSDTISDDDLVLSVDASPKLDSVYTGVNCKYNLNSKHGNETVIDLPNLSLMPGLNTFSNLALSTSPAINISGIKLLNAPISVELSDFTVGAHSIDLYITNGSTEPVVIDVRVDAYTIEKTSADITFYSMSSATDDVTKMLYIGTTLNCSVTMIEQYCLHSLDLANKQVASYQVVIRGYPLVEAGDTISIVVDSENINETVTVDRVTCTYAGSLMSTLDVTKTGGA